MFEFEIDDSLSDGNVVTALVTTPSGKVLEVISEVELVGRMLIFRQFAIWGVDLGPGELGWPTLRSLVRAVMETFDVDFIRIEEAWRTSGANPNRTTKTIEFRR